MSFIPAYLKTQSQGLLSRKVEKLCTVLESCVLCPRSCGVNRLQGETGYCQSGKEIVISSYGPHFGEEEPLVGSRERRSLTGGFLEGSRGGSGTIFLTHCNLLCVFCQNFEISHLGQGDETSVERTVEIMLFLQKSGCHNINFVTPTHFAPQLAKAVMLAAQKGLSLPIVWNCGGYESADIIKLLEGIVDIYMPDFKFGSREPAEKFCQAPDYFERCAEAIHEMHSQVGDLQLDEKGVATRGLLIRHLVLPKDLAGSKRILTFIAEKISANSYINIMAQYRPVGKAHHFDGLDRYPSQREFDRVIELAQNLGLTRGFQRKHLGWF